MAVSRFMSSDWGVRAIETAEWEALERRVGKFGEFTQEA
jgi:hypothetical protein